MNYSALLSRILNVVDQEAYLVPAAHVEPAQRETMALIARVIQAPDFEPDEARALVRRLHDDQRIDDVMFYSALHVIAASPRVANWHEAARLVGDQEQAAIEMGGPNLQTNLASVERHRGVLAFLQGHYDIALDYFSRAFERQHTAENLGNVLCTLIRVGDLDEARDLLERIRASFPARLVADIDARLREDPDLALLNVEE